MSELQFKRWFVSAWGQWLVRIEPRLGGDVGVSDLMVVVDERLQPVELKIWKGDRVSEIRPAQKVWHREARERGLVTLLAVGRAVGRAGWECDVAVWNSWSDRVLLNGESLRRGVIEVVREEWKQRARR